MPYIMILRDSLVICMYCMMVVWVMIYGGDVIFKVAGPYL